MGKLLEVLPGRLRKLLAYAIAFLVFAGAGYVVVKLISRVASLALAVAAAVLLAALLAPLVDSLVRLRLPRSLACLVAVIALVAAIGLVVALLGMGIAREVDSFRTDLAGGLDRLRDWLITGPMSLSEDQLDQVTRHLRDQLRGLVPVLTRGAANAVEAIGLALLAIVLLFFLLRDGRRIMGWLIGGLPGRHHGCARRAAAAGWGALQGYVRGSAIIAAVDATGIGIGLVVLGVPLALPLALITFIASFVPLIGATIAGALAVLVALATRGPLVAVLVLAVVLLVQNLEGNLLEPVIMGRAIRLHPAVILVVVAGGALVAGVGGALLATPLTAMTYRIVGVLRDCPGPPPTSADPTDPGDRTEPTDPASPTDPAGPTDPAEDGPQSTDRS